METIVSHIMSNAAGRASFTVKDIMDDPFVVNQKTNEMVVRSTMSRLLKKNRITRIGKGVYCLPKKNIFAPEISTLTVRIYRQIRNSFPLIKLCVYEGPWISPLLHHLASNQISYIEVEKDASEAVYHFLRKLDLKQRLYYEPDTEIMERYVNLNESGIILKTLISEAPTARIGDIRISSLEKLLVDIFADPDFFYLQGGEYFYIMENALSLYHINQSTLLRYASRRGIKTEMKKIIENIR